MKVHTLPTVRPMLAIKSFMVEYRGTKKKGHSTPKTFNFTGYRMRNKRATVKTFML